MIRLLALFVCAFTIVSGASVASAKPKVALTEIEGDTNGEVRASVIAALDGKDLALVNSKDVNRAATKVGPIADFTEKDFGKLAAALEADAIVLAKLDKTGETKSLKFRLYIHNKMEKGFTVSFKDPKSPKFRTALHDKMVEKITAATGDGDGDDEPVGTKPADPEPAVATTKPADPKPAVTPTKPVDAKPVTPPPPTPVSGDDKTTHKPDTRVAAVEPTEHVDAQVTPTTDRPHSANLIPVRVELGLSVGQRSFSYTTTMAGNPTDTSLSPGPGILVAAEVYPLELTRHPSPALARLGIAFSYDRTLSLDAPAGTTNASVTESAWSIGLRYRLVLGHVTERSPTLTIGVGYGQRQFSPDESGADAAGKTTLEKNTPASDLSIIDPGLQLRYPVNRRFALFAGARGLIITGAGAIQESTSYGPATLYGIDGNLGVDILLGKRYAVRVAGEITQVHYAFNGGGALTNLDTDATTKEVSALSDRTLGGSLTFGVLY